MQAHGRNAGVGAGGRKKARGHTNENNSTKQTRREGQQIVRHTGGWRGVGSVPRGQEDSSLMPRHPPPGWIFRPAGSVSEDAG